ncbi:MAG TPA: hypothetical protein VFW10_16485 [Steroidobacteraceae bacterium]|jgi:hypothetical protein|nr:hypothetical protein [Steroidobacteraceae bacterium]
MAASKALYILDTLQVAIRLRRLGHGMWRYPGHFLVATPGG